MKEGEALKVTAGMRVKHVPTNEEGTILEADFYVREYADETGSWKKIRLICVQVKPDLPEWLPVIKYYPNNKAGRKIKDLEVL